MNRGNDLILTVIEQPDNDEAAEKLLENFISGFPIVNLVNLITNQDERVAIVGMRIASELGEQFRLLIPYTKTLLKHPSQYVRFDAVSCVLACAEKKHGHELALALSLLSDCESSVLRRAADFQLHAALGHLGDIEGGEGLRKNLLWLLSYPGRADILAGINGQDGLRRKFAVAAAVRYGFNDTEVVKAARESIDKDIADFAADGFN